MIYPVDPFLTSPPALDNLDSQLPPPQPPDREGVRPKLDREQVNRQVRGIQQFLAGERAKAARKEAKAKGEPAK